MEINSRELLISNIIFLLKKYIKTCECLNDYCEYNESYEGILNAYKKLLYQYSNSELLKYREYLEKSLNHILNCERQLQGSMGKDFEIIWFKWMEEL